MDLLDLDYDNILPFVSEEQLLGRQEEVDRHHQALEQGTGAGAESLGWLHLPSSLPESRIAELEEEAARIRDLAEVFVCVGIGGSYLGARAALSFCLSPFSNQRPSETRPGPEIYFAGHNLSSDDLSDLLELIGDRPLAVNVISKSGTTTEPAIAFRILREHLERRWGREEARRRIIVTTDQKRGALKQMADAEGYRRFVIPDDVGGRFSVLTPVGLLPIAVSGISIRDLLAGARDFESLASRTSRLQDNPAYLYAVIRHSLYSRGKLLEIMAGFHPALGFLLEWWKQLAGESEGKNHKGIFPASVLFTTDLHSLGQWIQEGNRILFETFLLIESSAREVQVPLFKEDADGLNYLAGKSLDFINEKAYKGTAEAHREGGVPNLTLRLKDRSPRTLGQVFYFFERAIALSGYLLQVNPFDQPGVEFYKRNMFRLLNKPGFK